MSYLFSAGLPIKPSHLRSAARQTRVQEFLRPIRIIRLARDLLHQLGRRAPLDAPRPVFTSAPIAID
jgi:hypothetical protein